MRLLSLLALATAGVLCLSSGANAQATSDWAKVVNGHLTYKTIPVGSPAVDHGDHFMDFSYAGYGGGGVAIPDVATTVTVSPLGGTTDDTSAIQTAINTVSNLTPDANGFRGKVVLSEGTFNITGLSIIKSGVVLSGTNKNTTLKFNGAINAVAIQIGVYGSTPCTPGATPKFLSDAYVPSGSQTVKVDDSASGGTTGLSVGQSVIVCRPVTTDWVHYMGMDTLVRDGLPQTWLAVGTYIQTFRTLTAVDATAKTVTLSAPLSDSFDATYLGSHASYVIPFTDTRITKVGVQDLTIKAPAGTDVYRAVNIRNTVDAWVKNVTGLETQNAFIIDVTAQRVTLDHVINKVTTPQYNQAPTVDFDIVGSQVFVNKSQSLKADDGLGDWSLVTDAAGTGPIAVLQFSTNQHLGASPHQRWTTGLLVDSSSFLNTQYGTDSGTAVAFTNRSTAGTGQGWTTGWSVGWNIYSPQPIGSAAASLAVSAPPGAQNFCIFCTGVKKTSTPDGTYDGLNPPASPGFTPESLYLEQLYERLGTGALINIGYGM